MSVLCPPGAEPGLLEHLRQLPELRGASALPGHLPAARVPGHRSGHGGAAEGCQELGMSPVVVRPSLSKGFCTHFQCREGCPPLPSCSRMPAGRPVIQLSSDTVSLTASDPTGVCPPLGPPRRQLLSQGCPWPTG